MLRLPALLRPTALLMAFAVALLLAASVAQAHEIVSADGLRISHAFATPTPPGAPNGAAYMDISAKDAPVRLTGASSPICDAVEVHSMAMTNGTMQMRRIESLIVPSGETVKLRPGGGAHLMLIGLEKPLVAGERFPLTLEFANHDSVEVEVWVQQAGEGSADANGHH